MTDAGVIVVHPSQAHAVSPGPNKVLVAAVGGVLALLLLLLGALMMTMVTGDTPPELASDSPPGDATSDPGGSSATGVRRAAPPDDDVPDGTTGDNGSEDDGSGDSAVLPDGDGPNAVGAREGDDRTERRRRARRARPATATQRKDRESKERDADKARQRQAEQAAAAAAEAKKAERAQAEARSAQRDSNKQRIARGKLRMKKLGYDDVGDYPRKPKTALKAAQDDLNDTSAAKRFEKATRGTPKKAKAASSSGGSFNYKARLKNLVRKCLAKGQPCAKSLSRELGKINALSNRSSAARNKLQRDIVQCEKSCGLR